MEFWRTHRRLLACVAAFSLLGPQLAQAAALGIDSVRSSPRGWSVQSSGSLPDDVQAMEAATISQLFDRDTNTEYTAFDDQSVQVTLQDTRQVTAIRVFGAAPYQLTVQEKVSNGWRDIQGLKGLDLTQLTDTWHTFETNNPATTDTLRLQLTQSGSSASGLRELEIWSHGEHVPVETGSQLLALLADAALVDQALLAAATRAEGLIGSGDAAVPDDPSDNTFDIALDIPASQIKYAWLVYETLGLDHWASAVRVINDQPAVGGVAIHTSDAWSEQLERISPAWLRQGVNRVRFTVPSGSSGQYRVRNVRLLVETDNGANFVNYLSASQTTDSATIDRLYDGNADTGMVVYSGDAVGGGLSAEEDVALPPGLIDNPGNGLHLGWSKGNAPWKQALPGAAPTSDAATFELGFDRGVELEAVGFYLQGKLAGKIDLELYHSGDWHRSGMPSVSANALKHGWNDIAVASGNRVQGVRLLFTGGEGSSGEIRELSVRGSGIGGAWLPPDVIVTYPDAGQYYGREAYLRGFLQGTRNDSGDAQLFIAGKPLNHVNGEFQTLINKDDAGFGSDADATPWTVTIEAVYPDGSRTATIVPLFVNQGSLEDSAQAGMPPVTWLPITPGTGGNAGIPGAGIVVDPGAVDENLDISMMPLGELDIAALDTWMTNVTAPNAGYRFLPHGKHFKKKIEVRIKYQPNLLPPGFTEDDIRTFYFDEQAGKWKELELKEIDKAKKEVVALTDHFTDMVNAVIQVPDSPQNTQFNPTQIKDIKAADPGAKINLIEPPQANNMGDARVSYPIEVPPGRRGMQPQLAVQYNSGGGHTWLGHGWDISMQSISIDTRWGVPRYDEQKETETYLLNGEQLTPMAHVGELRDRESDKQFHARVEGAFQKIIRHGDSPKNYWWEVIDKSGTHYFYGGDDTTNGPNETSTLATTEGDIGKWVLRLVRDSNGNEIHYQTVLVEDSGIGNGNGGVAGQQIYLDKIYYTGYQGQQGEYEVSFVRDREQSGFDPQSDRRPDVSIDVRLGLKQVTADLLKRIDVRFSGQTVRSYTLEYEQGAYGKTLLKKIKQLDSNGSHFNAHIFDYYDEVRDEALAYQPLGVVEDWAAHNDGIKGDLRVSRSGFEDNASATSGVLSRDKGKHTAVTAGAPGNLACKSGTVGGSRSSNKSETDGLLTFADINGDGIADKIYRDGGTLKYRAGTITQGLSVTESVIAGISSFYADESSTTSKGRELVVGCTIGGAIGVTNAKTITKSKTYLSDVNGDGLVDVSVNGSVRFNYIDGGVSRFSADSNNTPNAIGAAGQISGGLIEQNAAELEQQIDDNPLHDVVRVWQAPFDGEVQVTAPVSLIEEVSDERAAYEYADGVIASIQLGDTVVWTQRIEAEDYSVKNPVGVEALQVEAGDRIYFRLQSVEDGNYDQVNWSPVISYQGRDAVPDGNGKDLYAYAAASDYLIAAPANQTISVPLAGQVRIDGAITKPVTSDDVTVQISHKGVVIWEALLPAGEPAQLMPNLEVNVEQEDQFAFHVRADSTVRWNDISWSPRLYYSSFVDADIEPLNDQGEPQLVMQATPSVHLYSRHIRREAQPWIVPETVQVVTNPTSGATESKSLAPDQEIQVVVEPAAVFGRDGDQLVFTVKRDNQLLAKMPLVVLQGQVFDPADLPPAGEPVVPDALPKPRVTLPGKTGDVFWFEYHSTAPALAADVVASDIGVKLRNLSGGDWSESVEDSIAVTLRTTTPDIRFGHEYRQWGQFAWNGNRDRADQAIDQSKLNLDARRSIPSTSGYDDITDGDELENKFEQDGYNPANDLFVLMFGNRATSAWEGYDDLTWVTASMQSSSRFGVDTLDIPDPVAGAGARAVVKITRTDSKGYSFGGSISGPVGGGSVGASRTDGKSLTLVDYQDMNGDRYPDVVGLDKIQYTAMHGGLEPTARHTASLGVPRVSESDSRAYTAGGSYALGKPTEVSAKGPLRMVFSSQPPSVGINGSVGKTDDEEQVGWSDVNGDGLPDRVYRNGMVALNRGYGFLPAEQWGSVTRSGKSENEGVGLGFSLGFVSIAGGLSLNRSDTSVKHQLFDVNGDGLPDRVTVGSSGLLVALNTGSGFLPEVTWPGARDLNKSATVTEGGNVAFTACVSPVIIPVKFCVNRGANYSKSMSREERTILDVNGDGYPDYVESKQDGEMRVRLNTNGRTNLLKSVQRPLGASFEIDYERAGNTYEMPQNKWVMSKVTVHDGFAGDGPDTQVTTFKYTDGYHDRRERDFFGFATVVVEERDTRVMAMPVYRSVTQTYHNASIYERGLLAGTVMRDGSGNPYTESGKTYRFVNVTTQQPVAREALPAQQSATIFPQAAEETSRFFEGQQQPGKQTRVAYLAYDAVGNVTHFVDYADVGAADDVEAKIRYFYDEAGWIMAAAESIKVYGNGTLMRQRESSIEPGTGNVRDIRQSLENGVARYDFGYDPYGNLKTVTGPANLNGERYGLSYGYDSRVNTHVVRIEDSFGYVSTARPNFQWGQVEESVDINQQKIRTTFDSVGRVTTITGPYEQQSGQATIRFHYHPKLNATDPLSWALTQHVDPQHPGDFIETALFTDGLKRVLQTKKDGAVGDGNGAPQNVMIVSGRVLFDHVGRSIEQYYPTTEPLGSAASFNASMDPLPPTRTEHDVLDRPLKVTIPDGTATRFAYGFGADRDGNTQFRTTVTDANGVKKDSFRDVRQLITAVKEYNQGGSEILWASYAYDPLKQITDVFDARNHRTRAEYDLLGRRVVLDNPDTGKVEMIYDPAGNLIKKITPNLRAKGEAIEYGYRFNRLETITYPEFSQNNISYEYGAPNAPHNGANRIVKMTDQAGWETRAYGPLGELTESTRNLQWAAGPAESYTTKYQYDTWNRLTQLTYPDGEVLSYRYNSGGQMSSVQGKKGSYDYHYVQQLHYDKFEQRTYLLYGNNTETRYAYDPFNRRLAHLTAGKGAGSLFMDLSYDYDRVGNITALGNAAAVNSPNLMGGKTSFSYQYDDLYRLTGSTGTFDTQPDKQHAYTLSMQYDVIHNITKKTQLHTLEQPGGQKITQQKTSYDWTYQYDGQQPHAPTHLGDRTFSYDANGNQLGWTHDKNGTRRTITWDEENRIQQIQDNGHTFTYTYDGSGQRMTKRGPQGETAYINQWMTLRNGEVGTKHIFAGTTRVVSKLVKQDKPNSKRNSDGNTTNNGNGQGKARIIYEKDQYYFHPDHLGTTAYITHTNGQVYQHLEYFPFGETWVEEHSNKQRTPYQFTGKELDEETGLYYFGARYYDPRTSVWMSTDPILGTYMDGRINAGLFNSRNSGLYSYVMNNPMKLKDAEGRWGSLGHHDVIFAAAFSGGLEPRQAAALAAAAWAPDTDRRNAMSAGSLLNPLNDNQASIHQLHGGDPSAVKPTADTEAAAVVGLFVKGMDLMPSDENTLHSFGDSRAHVDRDTGKYYKARLGHAKHMTQPDNPFYNVGEFMDYAGKAYDIMVEANGGKARISKDDYMSVMSGLIGIEDPAEQAAYLREAFSDPLKSTGGQFPRPEEGHGFLGMGE